MSYDILPKAKLQYLLTRLKEVFDGMVQGHTIKNNTGTSMTTRTSVQFGGYLKTTDDATNDRTIIDDSPIEISWAEFQALTDVQRANNKYLITDYPSSGIEITDVGVPSGASAGQVPTAVSDGDGGLVFQMQTPANSGHTIVNPSGTDMTSRGKLQFTGNVSVTDDSQNGKTVIDIPNMTLVDRTFNVVVADWITNPDSTTSSDYPYIYQISTAYYTASSKPIWQMNGAGTIPTSAEREDIDLIMEAIFDTTGITLYATDMPTNAMVLEVKG